MPSQADLKYRRERAIEQKLISARRLLKGSPEHRLKGIEMLNDALHEFGVHVSHTETNTSPGPWNTPYKVHLPERNP